jgi:hypothetical protein
MKLIIGAIYPVKAEQAHCIFDEGRTVFVKFTKMNDFKPNSKIIFYITKEKILCGEGTIKSIQRMSASDAWSKYSKQLFLNQEEYDQYSNWSSIEKKPRLNTELTVFVLKNLKKYSNCKSSKNITPSGCYISEEEYNIINPTQ